MIIQRKDLGECYLQHYFRRNIPEWFTLYVDPELILIGRVYSYDVISTIPDGDNYLVLNLTSGIDYRAERPCIPLVGMGGTYKLYDPDDRLRFWALVP